MRDDHMAISGGRAMTSPENSTREYLLRPPDPPSGTPCITAHLDTVTVAWSSSPYDGGRKVTCYVVEYTLFGSDIWTTAVDDCENLGYVVGGLQLGGRYVFRVRAVNVHGASRPSLESGIVQLEEHNESSSFEHRLVVPEPGAEFKSRYDVQEELGKGRFGVVHKVIDKTSHLKLAAKFIKCRNQKDKDKVHDEIDIMNLLRHQKLLQLAAAFENPREMIMVMEYISGGELFERVVADDFTLTEKDCILFTRQICEGVAYMHTQSVVHLDLKPENIMCHTRTSHEIKIIDFGLAQKLEPDKPVRVLFGTPEFIAPEIISYEPIGTRSDMWSLGVICYVLLSGLSPFMGDSDSETFANITRADYDFDDEAFGTVSQNARNFIGALLVKRKEDRMSAEQCLKHVWLDPDTHRETVVLSTDKLKKFIIRRKWQKTGNAIRALGRMATLSASRRNSANSTPNTPRVSFSGGSVPRMPSVEDRRGSGMVARYDTLSASFDETEEVCGEVDHQADEVVDLDAKVDAVEEVSDVTETIEIGEKVVVDCGTGTTEELEEGLQVKESKSRKLVRTRACSERSDSGISDCSTHLTSSSCTSTPLLGKKFPIDEEDGEYPSEEKLAAEGGAGEGEFGGRSKSDDEDGWGSDANKRSGKLDGCGVNAKSQPPNAGHCLSRLPVYTSRTVTATRKKFDRPEATPTNQRLRQAPPSSPAPVRKPRPHAVDRLVERLEGGGDGSTLRTATPTVRFRSPSPSLLRKTQAVIAKEQWRDDPERLYPKNGCPKSPGAARKERKPKSEAFQRAAAFWNTPKT
ncbi:myosin light chain kinase, smooth muscle [Cylas formicarius]|uniref:myosin light chain kinase, smooth muscle n=1 Tax=Cylas formicarius TaxID=197179 RepID=UPI0029588CF4|nr:myosin light chain kinase, smooth muscle [Cylas formicarius]